MSRPNQIEAINSDLLLDILGNQNKRMILAKLTKVPHSASELAQDLNISRQAVHVQLKSLEETGIIEKIGDSGKYRINMNFSITVDISPNYFNIKYNTSKTQSKPMPIELKSTEYSSDYKTIKAPDKKIKFLGKKIQDIESNINALERERKELLTKKECCIVELKNIMENKYKKDLIDTIRQRRTKERLVKQSLNLGEEILFTLFFNPEKYLEIERIKLDTLLDDLFADMDSDLRNVKRVSVQPLLRDLSKLLDIIHEEDDDWFFRF
ncbi:MAG: ArsR/SmtB family transcription factor [Promethearchaeota archaeon]